MIGYPLRSVHMPGIEETVELYKIEALKYLKVGLKDFRTHS